MQIKQQVEKRGAQSYRVLFIPSDEFGVIDDLQAIGDALANIVGHSARKVSNAQIAHVLRSVAGQYDIDLSQEEAPEC